MARMVFGQWTTEDAASKVEHFAAVKIQGRKTACNRKITRATLTWKDAKMVTCPRCRKALGL